MLLRVLFMFWFYTSQLSYFSRIHMAMFRDITQQWAKMFTRHLEIGSKDLTTNIWYLSLEVWEIKWPDCNFWTIWSISEISRMSCVCSGSHIHVLITIVQQLYVGQVRVMGYQVPYLLSRSIYMSVLGQI